MRYSSQVKPISYLKANAAEVLTNLAEHREPLVITQNGEAKAVLQDVASFEQTQETLALLKILALGHDDNVPGKLHRRGQRRSGSTTNYRRHHPWILTPPRPNLPGV
ncbi:type II toxin-antitoxin system Phd/YefM family antitoxin [Microvirga sp. 2TAF3]|uniref:type II toxin-antitoxin system Phd/YefM family antitoxin n=1 Tax=Microvirga sp. 2TAF3 TaxID=3233014 RepID=UPI003F9750DE